LALRIREDPVTRQGAGCTVIDCLTNRRRAPLDAPWSGRAALRPDGRLLALSHGGAVTLWDATTGRRVGALDGRLDVDVKWLAFSPDGKTLLAAGNAPLLYGAREQHAYLKLWEVATRRERAGRKEALLLREPGPDNGWGMVTPFSPDGKRVALPCQDFRGGSPATRLRCWDTLALKPLGEVKTGRQDELRHFAFTPDGAGVALVWGPSVAAAGKPFAPAALTVIGLADGKERVRIVPPACGFAAVAYSPDGRLMVTQDNQGTIRIWERERRR
jgi:WD40 repeat protein